MNEDIDGVFVYGTLMDEGVRLSVLGSKKDPKSAVLKDYRLEGLNIIEELGSIVEGQVFEVTEEDLLRLDQYESVSTGLYEQIYVVIGTKKYIAYQKCDPNSRIIQEM